MEACSVQLPARLSFLHTFFSGTGRHQFNLSPPFQRVSCCRRTTSPLSVSMRPEGNHVEISPSETETATFSDSTPKYQVEETLQSHIPTEEVNGKSELDVTTAGMQHKRSAKIHDFCFGIPFGGIILGGGLVSFIFTRNPATLSGVLYGGALLVLSTSSLKIWRQGKSSFPYILGQAALAAALLWKHLQIYYSTKKVFPTGFFAVLSAAMLSFYTYVMASGGNPPPKKLKSVASPSS